MSTGELVRDAHARVVRALEALRDGDHDFADQLLDDLSADLWTSVEARAGDDRTTVALRLKPLEGRQLLRVVDCSDAVELVFEGRKRNLMTIGVDPSAPNFGTVQLGYIAPDLVASGYGDDS